jgi:hypothetical protein
MKYLMIGLLCFMLGVFVGHSAAWNSGYEYAKTHFKHSFEEGLKGGKTFSITGWDKLKFYPRFDKGINVKGVSHAVTSTQKR